MRSIVWPGGHRASALRVALIALLAASVVLFGAAAAYGLFIGDVDRVSISTTGQQGNGKSSGAVLSSTGRYIAFESTCTNLVSGDTNNLRDVFVRDNTTGVMVRASLTSTNAQSNGESWWPAISGDGRYVVFTSDATNLVPGDTNGMEDVFLRDLVLKTTKRVSVGPGNIQANGMSFYPAISADGRYVAYTSQASNLVANDTNGQKDCFVYNMLTGVTRRVSVTSGGLQCNGSSQAPVLSSDGRYVAFHSVSSNLVPNDTNPMTDIFVRDTVAATTERVSLTNGGLQCNGNNLWPCISGNGRYVSFWSSATNLVANDTNGVRDTFVRDRVAGTTTRVSVSSAGVQGNGDSSPAAISADGKYVTFTSVATNLVAGDTNAAYDVFVRDQTAGTTRRVSVKADGTQGNGDSYALVMSGDNRYWAFESDATNLVAGDTNDQFDIFIRGPYATIENDAPGVTFGRFINGFSAAYSGGSYTYAYSKAPYTGSRLEARFKGNKVRWVGPKNPAYGMAKVYVDGVYKATVDCYGASAVARATLWESALLTDAVHTISIVMAAGKNPASSGYVVVIDRFEAEGALPARVGARANETAGAFTGTWIKITGNPTYTGSSYAYSYWPPAKFRYTFTGTKCAWIGPKIITYGNAAIYLDGVYKGTISQYAPSTATSFRARVWESATLPTGTHTLEIRPLGTKVTAATGKNVVMDAVDYLP